MMQLATAQTASPVRRNRVSNDPERRCLASGRVCAKSDLLRFVVGPDGGLTVDLAARLPGRGLYVLPSRELLDRAVRRGLFARAAARHKLGPVSVPADLADRVETLLQHRCRELVSLARRAGQAVAGFEKTAAWVRAGRAAVLLQASDGAAAGVAKLDVLAGGLPKVDVLDGAALAAAFGRPAAVVHGAVAAGGLAAKLAVEAARLGGLRPPTHPTSAHMTNESGPDAGAAATSTDNAVLRQGGMATGPARDASSTR